MSISGTLPYNGEEYYELRIGDIERRLPVVRINPTTWIASFVMLGDVRLIEHCARLLIQRLEPGFEVVAVPEAKAIPLTHSIARLADGGYGLPYCVFRKSHKSYMTGELSVPVNSITTAHEQRLYLDSADAQKLRGRRVLLIDDVVSTGSTLSACAELIRLAGGILYQTAAALLEGEARATDFCKNSLHPLVHLAAIPVFVAPQSAA